MHRRYALRARCAPAAGSAFDAHRRRDAPRSTPARPCARATPRAKRARARVCAAALAAGNSRGDLQPQRNEHVRPRRRRPLRGIESGDPDAVVAHDRIVVGFGQRDRRRDAGGIEVAFGREIHQRRHGIRGAGARQPGAQRRVFIEQHVPARHRLLLVAAQRPRAGPAELSAAPRAGAPPSRVRCARSLPSSASAVPQARRQRRARLARPSRSRNAASSAALNSSLRPVAQSAPRAGAREHVVLPRETAAAASARPRRSAGGR